MRKTKIICTLGPSTDDENILRQIMLSGMDVARLNFSHGTHEEHKRRVDAVKKLRKELGLPVALMLDTKGPEIRTGDFSHPVELKTGDSYTLTTRPVPGTEKICSVSFSRLPYEVAKNSRILIDDGLIELQVDSIATTDIFCTVMNGGQISSHKSINIPGITLSLPFISEKDRQDLAFAAQEDFDFIAASFTRSAQDVIGLRKELEKLNCHKIQIISKIENAGGVQNIDDIIRLSDGVMVARGDLGVEIPLEEIPIIQKKIIRKALSAGKEVITATQMLDSMIKNPRPTRAETTDVANAIYDGTSAIMLSGETAAGAYPVLAVRTMAKIAERTEADIDYAERFRRCEICLHPDVTTAISHATCTTAHDLGAAAILTVTKSGHTARMISRYRPSCPIISGTTDLTVLRQMNLCWGVVPIMVEEQNSTEKLFCNVINAAEGTGLIRDGDLVVITAGVPLGMSGTTNLLKVQIAGSVLVTGTSAVKGSVSGRVCVCKTPEAVKKLFSKGDILVIPDTTNELLPYLKSASAIVTECEGITSHAAVTGITLNKPIITGAKDATRILRSGMTVTVDASHGIVYSRKQA